jgi:hypothetical protein
VADEQQRRRWRRRDRSNEQLQLETKEVREAVKALRAGDLDGAEEAIQVLRREIRDEVRGSDSYVPVFLLTLFLVVAVPLSTNRTFFAALLTVVATATVILSLHRSHIRLRVLRQLSVIAVIAGAGNILSLYLIEYGQSPQFLVATSALLFTLLLGTTLPAMLRRVLTSRRVSINTLAGAITAYLLLGLMFGTMYRFVAVVTTQPFFSQKPVPTGSDFEYFSFITMTTVGYGDLSPGNDAARAGAVSEAIIGQVFLVTIVARVVSTLGLQHEMSPDDPEPPDGAD